ncbi:glycoside hydrolase family 31 protein [Agilicoccus flavus]|uniref:glycoside hydrolase family 31 protein n=1 Tax=Agilicoccus flavus TaxID=2775968 RepID=UPI001CF6C593|nr:glycoside hydrolase family 31 protein [Agilicoccus flavus]
MSLPERLRPPVRPIANAANVIAGEHHRITVLDAGLLRLEYSPDGAFEDRASQTAWFRDGPPVEFTATTQNGTLTLDTERLHLTYDLEPFSSEGLFVQVKGGVSNYHSVWRYEQPVEGNLGGTARTLDEVDGRTPLEPGVLSRMGVTVHDDSASLLLTDDGWLAPREPGRLDLYVFAYGRDYDAALRAFFALTGSQPVVPRFALGNWWSRYHPYDDVEYLELLDRFEAARLPFSVAVIDMDWHLVDVDPRFGSGWTGYSWNRDLFTDPPAFLRQVHERGLAVTLNVHPADGVRAFEDAYPDAAAAMGIDPATQAPVAFDPADPRFLTTYLEAVHHPREEEGVDFWWVDWQSGPFSAMRGLDPLWILNHLHFLDSGRADAPRGPRRPLTFSRYAGVGSHRYPIGFSGDSVISWASLAFQPEFTATAANVGYGWWSHDVGGHMFGISDDELATRWVQLGVFSPIMRLHSSNDPFTAKEPWRFGAAAERVMGAHLRLRHRLVPYLHTMNRRAHEDGRSLVRPMYHDHPHADAAYDVPNEYAFGDDLVVAPVTSPARPASRTGAVDAWIPPGDHVDLFTGLGYAGGEVGRRARLHRTLDQIPVLAPAGTVLPLAGHGDEAVGVQVPDRLDVLVVAGACGSFTLAEDADDDAWSTTELTWDELAAEVVIGAASGASSALPTERTWRVVLVGFGPVEAVEVDGRRLDVTPAGAGSPRGAVAATLPAAPAREPRRVRVLGEVGLAPNDIDSRCLEVLAAAQMSVPDKAAAREALLTCPRRADALLPLRTLDLPEDVLGALTEILLAR